MAEDKINHPSHYTALSVEPIVLARHCDFCSGNVLKFKEIGEGGAHDASKQEA